MAERSFTEEVKKLRLEKGETFHGEGILAVTKALLQSGVAYVGGYQGAPISHLMDVLADAQQQGILEELDVHFESSASEAAAAAMLAASVNYPLRGAVAWKSTVGTNVASDALANLASGGVNGGAYNADAATWFLDGGASPLESDGALRHRIDFRTVLADIFQGHLGMSPADTDLILPDFSTMTPGGNGSIAKWSIR